MTRWVLAVPDVRWHSWDQEDEAVVFDPASGDTHVVSVFALEILTLLRNSSGLGIDALRDSLADVLPDEGAAGMHGAIDAALVQLRNIGLVVPTPLESLGN